MRMQTCKTCGQEVEHWKIARETTCCATAQCIECNIKERSDSGEQPLCDCSRRPMRCYYCGEPLVRRHMCSQWLADLMASAARQGR